LSPCCGSRQVSRATGLKLCSASIIRAWSASTPGWPRFAQCCGSRNYNTKGKGVLFLIPAFGEPMQEARSPHSTPTPLRGGNVSAGRDVRAVLDRPSGACRPREGIGCDGKFCKGGQTFQFGHANNAACDDTARERTGLESFSSTPSLTKRCNHALAWALARWRSVATTDSPA
jgi:hypothetical protein